MDKGVVNSAKQAKTEEKKQAGVPDLYNETWIHELSNTLRLSNRYGVHLT